MNKSFETIFLTWRVGRGHSRIIVGEIRQQSKNVIFTYIAEGVKKAQEYGFKGYPGLSLDQRVHTSNVIELFAKRLINLERPDSKGLLDFWEVNDFFKNDTLYMLAMTQGKMQTDSFEFLASFIPEKNLVFVTDVAGITHHNFKLDRLKIGDQLNFELDSKNPNDSKAVKILYQGDLIGFIKKGHNEVFYSKLSKNLRIEVKSITNTPAYKDLYIKIYSV